MTVEITRGSYGFGYDWTLKVFGRSFWLGQDVKFCSRVLGMQPSEVVQEVGTNRFDTEEGLAQLAEFITKQLGITEQNVQEIESWGLCAQ